MMPRSALYVAVPVVLISSVVWIVALGRHTFLAREIWLYIGLFTVPAGLVCVSAWMILQRRLWVRVVGGVLALPALGVWGLSLLLVWVGFKIH
jgi:hypothetical protein